jgi:hypothetical protein
MTIEKALAYYEICPFSVNYESVIFDSTGPGEKMQQRPV